MVRRRIGRERDNGSNGCGYHGFEAGKSIWGATLGKTSPIAAPQSGHDWFDMLARLVNQ